MDPVALAALIISLIALLVTTAQLLQQYFATADGYRQCLPSVMGTNWGHKTRKRMRWRELRYETLYYVPSLSIDSITSPDIDRMNTEIQIFHANWETLDLAKKYAVAGEKRADEQIPDEVTSGAGEKVCWVALLDRLRQAQGDIRTVYDVPAVRKEQREGVQAIGGIPAIVCMRILKRSWDFMPPEIVRPLCMSTLSDIAVFAIRLGMEWKEFKPITGTLLAEGSGQLMTSRIVPSLGMCIGYTRTARAGHSSNNESVPPRNSTGAILLHSYLPAVGVSDLIFGVVSGNEKLHCIDRVIGTLDSITGFLDFLDNTGAENLNMTKHLRSAMKWQPGWIPGFNDVIPLTAAKMSSVMSNLRNLPMPNGYSPGLLRTREGLQVFCQRLLDYVKQQEPNVSEQLLHIQSWILKFQENYDQYWNANDIEWASVPPNQYIFPVPAFAAAEMYQMEIHNALDQAEAFLVSINSDPLGSTRSDRKEQKSGFCYDNLLVEHLRMSIPAYEKFLRKREERDLKNQSNPYPTHWEVPFPTAREWLVCSMHLYWDDLPTLSTKVAELTGCEVQLAVDAWVTMIFRGFCWHHCHHLVINKMILPSEWRGSQMPVYIG